MGNSENTYRGRKKMILDNFLGGISWSVGVWVGTTFIIALLVFFFSKIDFIPVIGDFVGKVMGYAARTNSPFPFR